MHATAELQVKFIWSNWIPAQAPGRGVIPHPIPEVNFLMVEITTPKPYIFMIRVIRLCGY
jgi:hypothetical protein